jgi:crotonobetaine/carnitine-CoA ligase
VDIMGESTIIDLLHEKCRLHGEKDFLLFEDQNQQQHQLTYNEFLDRVNRFSQVLLEFGVEKGDRVTLHLPNSSDFIVSWFSLANIGAIMVPTNVLSTTKEMEYLIENSESVLLITEEEYLDKLEPIKENASFLKDILLTRCTNNDYDSLNVDLLIDQADNQAPNITLKSEDVVSILYTSGTTSLPKGCLITHANYLYTGEVVSKSIRFSPEDRGLIVLPLFHGNGQYYLFMPALIAGGSIAVTERFSASQYFKQAKRMNATLGSLFAAPIRMILANKYDEADKDNLLRLILFAQSVTKEEMDTFEYRYDTSLLQIYGMTETIAPPLMNPLDGVRDNTGIGKPSIGSDVKVVDELGVEVPQNHVGEIVLKGVPGRTIMKGYFRNQEATDETIQNGWLRTGDKAKIEENGHFYFVDRSKDMLKKAGENIAASEVENAIMEHPSVYEAVVVGVPDSIRDEAIKAYIIPKEGHSVTKEALFAYFLDRLSKFKVPDIIEFVDDFPRTSVGKIQKHQLRSK